MGEIDEKILKWLYDIKFAIAEIDSYFENKIFGQFS